MNAYWIKPDPDDPALTRAVQGVDQNGDAVDLKVVTERPLTLFLNGREIVTLMTIGDHPDYLALGFLANQAMLAEDEVVSAVEYDEEAEAVVVRTEGKTDYEAKLEKKIRTSGCAQGTVFGDVMEHFDRISLDDGVVMRTSWLERLLKELNTVPSLYLEAGAIHGCALCAADQPLLYMEDVGRHNAVDKIAGYMLRHGVDGRDKIFYTTGRLTSEMVIKCAVMGVPILVSRSGFTAWGVELAERVGLTMIGRARGKRFTALTGRHRLRFDHGDRAEDAARAEEAAE